MADMKKCETEAISFLDLVIPVSRLKTWWSVDEPDSEVQSSGICERGLSVLHLIMTISPDWEGG